ncbi:MAG: alpha/beta fold hydrolase [Pseudomonadota bacterium]|nr:alpha/beta fold hydrolase [Pseudomonadota bacterium]
MQESEPQFLTVKSEAGARRIAYRRILPREASGPGVIWMSGLRSDMMGSKATAVAEWARKNERPCLRFDYSGHGESDGAFIDGTIGQWLEESMAALRELADGPHILIGSSMGGWLALLILQAVARNGADLGRCRIAGAILIAPAWDMTEALMLKDMPPAGLRQLQQEGVYRRPSHYGDEPYPITRTLIEEGRAHLIGNTPFDPGVPVHVLQGKKDEDVPWQHGAALAPILGEARVTNHLVADGDHRLSRPQDIERLLGLLDKLSDDVASARG